MNRTHSSLLVALLLATAAAATLAAPPALAEEAAAPAVAAPAIECGTPAAPLADAAVAGELFSTLEEPEPPSLGDPEEPLFAGVPCNQRRCGAREFCCNFSCSICASIFGGACTQQVCPIGP